MGSGDIYINYVNTNTIINIAIKYNKIHIINVTNKYNKINKSKKTKISNKSIYVDRGAVTAAARFHSNNIRQYKKFYNKLTFKKFI